MEAQAEVVQIEPPVFQDEEAPEVDIAFPQEDVDDA